MPALELGATGSNKQSGHRTTQVTHIARRMCPSCHAPDPIGAHAPLWPHDWVCPACGYRLPIKSDIPCLAPHLDGQLSGFDTRSFKTLAQVEAGHFWFEERNRLIAWLAQRYSGQPSRVIEIGCGTGFVIGALCQALPEAQITGSELHSAGLKYARRRCGDAIELIQMDARWLGLCDAVDIVCAFDVLEHIEEDEAVIASICRALVPGGLVFITVPQHPWLWSSSDDFAHHVRRYAITEMQGKLQAGGLEVLFSDSFTSSLLPLMILIRTLNRKPNADEADYDELIGREFKLNPFLNGLFRAALRCEHTLRRLGLRLPCGGSRVVVGRKSA